MEMTTMLGLRVRQQDLAWQPVVDLRPDRLRKWAEKLPKLNINETVITLTKVLMDINLTSLAPVQRLDVLAVLVPDVDNLVAMFCKQSASLSFPLPLAKRELHDRNQSLLEEIAAGYKAVVAELIRGEVKADGSQAHLQDALLYAIQYLGQQILLKYSIYESAPASCWGELHRLYEFAEQKGLEGVRVEHLADQSIRDAYLRVVMLGLANPMHLMQGEAVEVYGLLRKWALAARLLRLEERTDLPDGRLAPGDFFVDLASDEMPQCCLSGKQYDEGRLRIVAVQEVVNIVSGQVKKLTQQKHLDISSRLHRDLLRRLRNAWGSRQERQHDRIPQSGVLVATVGLNAAHHFIAGEREFNPEEEEIRLHGSKFQRKQELSLVPLEQDDWKSSDTQSKLAKGVLKPRSFGFDVDVKEDDVWKKAVSTTIAMKTGLEQTVEERTLKTLVNLDYRDDSPGGMGLEYAGGKGIRLSVGELVAIRCAAEPAASQWHLCAIRWLFCGDTGSMVQIGLSAIGSGGIAVAVRGMQGEGAGSHYLRALYFPGSSQDSLILPTGRFDTGSRLLLNDGHQLQVAEMLRIQQASKTFSQFLIRVSTPAPEEQEQIVQSLYRVLQ